LDHTAELPYLTLFTPLVLSSTTTTTTSPSDQILQVHFVTLSAPSPFKRHHFSATFQLKTDAESQKAISLSINDFLPSHGHKDLCNWIDRRLSSQIFSKDLGGLGWGMSRFWDALISRAQVWKTIELALPQFVLGSSRAPNNEPDDSYLFPTKIAPYLARSSLLLRATEIDRLAKRALLITYRLCLSEWTAKVESEIGICAAGVGRKVEEQVQKAFAGLVRKKGVVEAVKGIAGMVLGD
jgi:hypothetical protein